MGDYGTRFRELNGLLGTSVDDTEIRTPERVQVEVRQLQVASEWQGPGAHTHTHKHTSNVVM